MSENLEVFPVILSGGSGSRLWPKSRHHYPKQLHQLYGDKTMLQETIRRVSSLGNNPMVICNQDQRFMVAEQVAELGVEGELILEPVARNTAPAIVVAALRCLQKSPEALIAVFAADHLVKNQPAFEQALGKAVVAASEGKLVTFGVVPDKPETGYGYIKSIASESGASKVEAFVEKPDLETAKTYLASGEYFWNSGMFVFSAAVLIEEVSRFYPEMVNNCQQALDKGVKDLDFYRLDQLAFSECENESIDYAVMEKTDKAFMVPLDAGWSDVGSWEALWDVGDKDENGNVLLGDVLTTGSSNCYVSGERRLVSLVGVDNLVVVETADSVLVARKDQSQKVKDIVSKLKNDHRSEYLSHREVFRPWGSYDLVDTGARFQVKRISVKPGATVSLQMHHHRAEHWVVVCGTAEVQKGDERYLLSENQSTYIPLGEKHKLHNPGKLPLYLIEVASGSYLEEDDVVRLDEEVSSN